MRDDELEVRQNLDHVLHQPHNDVVLLRPRDLHDLVALDHLVRFQSVVETALEDCEHHVEGLLEILRVSGVTVEHVLQQHLNRFVVALPVDRRDIQQLCHIEDVVLREQASVELDGEILRVGFHALRQPVEYFERGPQSLVHLFFETALGFRARSAQFAVVQALVQIDLYLFEVVVFSHVL